MGTMYPRQAPRVSFKISGTVAAGCQLNCLFLCNREFLYKATFAIIP